MCDFYTIGPNLQCMFQNIQDSLCNSWEWLWQSHTCALSPAIADTNIQWTSKDGEGHEEEADHLKKQIN